MGAKLGPGCCAAKPSAIWHRIRLASHGDGALDPRWTEVLLGRLGEYMDDFPATTYLCDESFLILVSISQGGSSIIMYADNRLMVIYVMNNMAASAVGSSRTVGYIEATYDCFNNMTQ